MDGNFWLTKESARHIAPNQEGFDPVNLLAMFNMGMTVDYGCGYGRLASAFPPSEYIGYDVSADRIKQARALHPKHRFEVLDDGTKDWLCTDSLLLYTVAVHLEDDEVQHVVAQSIAHRIILAEVIGRRYRRDGTPPVYNREVAEYDQLLWGYRLHALLELPILDRPYPMTIMDWRLR